MEPVWRWGIDCILELQHFHGPVLDNLFRAITALGSEPFSLLVALVLFWRVNAVDGARLAVLLLVSLAINADLKELLKQPRPIQFAPELQLVFVLDPYGLPSGHAQSAVVTWGFLTATRRIKGAWVAGGALLVLLIGFSRVYLGVHFPTDVLAGWAIGAALLGLFLVAERRFVTVLRDRSPIIWQALAVGVPLVLVAVYPVEGCIRAMGLLAGLGCGLAYPVLHGAGRKEIVSRVALFFALYVGLRLAFPADAAIWLVLLEFLAFALLGVWGFSGLAPHSFR